MNLSRGGYAVVTFDSPSGVEKALSAHHPNPLGVTQYGRRSGGGGQPAVTSGPQLVVAATGSQLRGTAESVVVPSGRVSGRQFKNALKKINTGLGGGPLE